MMRLAIAGIHTGIGKTIVSAVLAEALGADYWKPVQAGSLEHTDSDEVRQLISNGATRVHPEAIRLTSPLSPHAAARIDGVQLSHRSIVFPAAHRSLVVETAGGLLSPFSEEATMADFIQYFHMPLVLVSANYLGSINHTLLCAEVLRGRKMKVMGIVISGPSNASSESYIEQHSGFPVIVRVPFFDPVTALAIQTCAAAIRPTIQKIFYEHYRTR